jgi:hypothetical protein
MSAFLKAIDAACTASALMGPFTNWSISSLGIDGKSVAAAAAAFVVFLLGIRAPGRHAMPRTQNSGQARPHAPSLIAFIVWLIPRIAITRFRL